MAAQSLDDLASEVARLRRQVARLEATEQVRRLQNIYGYYMDRFFYEEVVPLMADDCEIRFMGGIYRGRDGARRLFIDNLGRIQSGGRNGPPEHGRLAEHEMLSDVITVSDDALTAKGRFRHLLKAGWHVSRTDRVSPPSGIVMDQWEEGGLYENEYILEDGAWKFRRLDYQLVYFEEVGSGWRFTPDGFAPWFTETFPQDPAGPDELMRPAPEVWPRMVSVPYHYPNPVTGRFVAMPSERSAPADP